MIAYYVLDQIVGESQIVADQISRADVDIITERLINGDLGIELSDFVSLELGIKEKAVLRAMAQIMNEHNRGVSISDILDRISERNYRDDFTGEVISSLLEQDVLQCLTNLEKMDIVEKDTQREKCYLFTTELYRLFMQEEKKIRKFTLRRED